VRASFWAIFSGLLAAMLLTPVGSAIAAPNAAPLYFCNRASVEVEVAVGYYSSGVDDGKNQNVLTGPFVSRGFWPVGVGRCQSFDNPFNARYMFWFALEHDTPRSHPIIDDATAIHMCASGKAFTFEDENVSQDACEKSPIRIWVLPKKVDTAVDPNVNFTGDDY
jgi:uncharacterized membrane protein